jgi:threonine aldolase
MTTALIDLRSDTVTRPTPAMRAIMAAAEVGDDVFGDDPSVRAIERATAERLGKEAALFVPTGTMANQLAVAVHAGPGDELICDEVTHVYAMEGGGMARISGVTARPLRGERGLLTPAMLADKIRPDDAHYVRTRLVWLENTHNRGGGRVHPLQEVAEIGRWARSNRLSLHLDGARLMNAVVASGVPAAEWARHADTVSICFSKGLGAPVGSALAGSAEVIRKAHRLRKCLGGGMRQAGVIAAAALHALENHVERLADDHHHAQLLARAVEETEGLSLESGPPETNLVFIQVAPSLGAARHVAARLRDDNILIATPGPQVLRACTHLDVSSEQVEFVADRIRALCREPVAV